MISRERILELAKANAGGGNASMTPHEFSELLDGYVERSPSGRERQEFIDRAAIAHSAMVFPSKDDVNGWTSPGPDECYEWAEELWEEREERRNAKG